MLKKCFFYFSAAAFLAASPLAAQDFRYEVLSNSTTNITEDGVSANITSISIKVTPPPREAPALKPAALPKQAVSPAPALAAPPSAPPLEAAPAVVQEAAAEPLPLKAGQQKSAYEYRLGRVGFSARFGGTGAWTGLSHFIYSYQSGLIIDWYVKKRPRRYTPLIQFRFSFSVLGANGWRGTGRYLDGFRGGVLFGGSTLLMKTKRFSLLLDGGLAFDFPLHTDILNAYYPINTSVELSLKTVFHMHKYAAFSLGAGIAYGFGTEGGKEGRPLTVTHGFTWSASAGFIF